MAKKIFKDINGVVFTDAIGNTLKQLEFDTIEQRLDEYSYTNGDEIFVINHKTLRVERFIVKRHIFNTLVCIRATKDRQLLPSSRYYGEFYGLIGDRTGLTPDDILRVTVSPIRSHCGNVFTSLDEANVAIDKLVKGKVFKTAPINSNIYIVDREKAVLTEHKIIDKEECKGTLTLYLNDNIHVRIGTTAFESSGSDYTDMRTFMIRDTDAMRYLYSRTIFIEKETAAKYLKRLILQRQRRKTITPQEILKNNNGKKLTKQDSSGNTLKVGDKILISSNNTFKHAIVLGETNKMVKALLKTSNNVMRQTYLSPKQIVKS